MRVFNLAEELEKERKKNKELKEELKEAKESITWWTNRFNSAEAEVRTFKSDFEAQAKLTTEYKNRIDRAIEYIKAVGVLPRQIDSFVLLDILEGDNK